MATANALFAQADTNNDQRLDLNEFRKLIGSNSALSGTFIGDLASVGTGGGYGSSSFQSSSYESLANGGALGGDLAFAGAGAGAGAGSVGYGGAGYGSSSYESSSYNSSIGNVGGDLASVGGVYNAGGAVGLSSTDLASTNYASSTQTTAVQQYETDAQGLFKDTNPQILRRPAPGGGVTYTQHIKVRFLQPPPIPPPGPLIIKEVRPPQPPPPPPLRIRQQAPPLPQPPPLVLRERPPPTPASTAAQTVIRRLAALPVPPRSVIIERLPGLPPKPRDIIIERWIPYGAAAKRKTIVERAAAAKGYARPRNVIIQYEPVQVRVVRQFQRLGVSQENPQAYLQRHGAILLDSQTLVQQARSAGVVEDISPPALADSLVTGSSQFASSTGSFGYEAGGLVGGATDLDAGGYAVGGGLGGAASYESSSYSASSDASGLGAGLGIGRLVGAGLGGVGGSSYESSSYSSSTGATLGNSADAAFVAADTNRDGVLSQSEFRAAGY